MNAQAIADQSPTMGFPVIKAFAASVPQKGELLQAPMALLMLRLLAASVFAGRAWQHLRWDSPLRSLFWKQDWLEAPVLWLSGMSWEAYVTHPWADQALQAMTRGMGWIFLACALAALAVPAPKKWFAALMITGTGLLTFLSVLYFISKNFQWGQLIEYSLQVITPLALLAYMVHGGLSRRWWQLLCWAVALTFVGHGLYAIGYHPQPGHFVTMTMKSLGVGESAARALLKWAGILDFAVALCVFIPRLRALALGYAAFWGTLTALARMVAYFEPRALGAWMDAWIYQTVYRLTHGGMPLLMLILLFVAGRAALERTAAKRP